MTTVAGFDPGTNNFGFSVVRVEKKRKLNYEILEHGMLGCAVKEMKGMDVGKRIGKFEAEIKGIRQDYNVDFAIGERFMTRGRGGGSTIELISGMLFTVRGVFKNVCFVPAASWKNSIHKVHDLEALYVDMAEYGIPSHRVDAVCIGLYGATLLLNEPHFSMLSNLKQFKTRLIQTR